MLQQERKAFVDALKLLLTVWGSRKQISYKAAVSKLGLLNTKTKLVGVRATFIIIHNMHNFLCIIIYLPHTAYAQAGLSNRFKFVRLSSLSSHKICWKNLKTSHFEGTTISKQEVNTEVPDTVACLHLI